MSSLDAANAPGWAQGEQDLGPLAWVLDELRKSLEGAAKAMRRFVRDAEVARESDLASLDAGPLRIARQQLHQACGALEMVGMAPTALVLRTMETAVQRFLQRPELCNDDAAGVIERASFALIEYLEQVLAGKPVSPVALFPQYRDAQALAGGDRAHPADLWPMERRVREPDVSISEPPLPYGPQARARLDSAVLRIVKNGDPAAAASMRATSLGFAAAQVDRRARAFWKISAGFFEALAQGLLTPDVYVKRAASRVLMQYASLAKGDSAIGDRLVHDLLFFCAQARVPAAGQGGAAPLALKAVRQAFGLERHKPLDYDQPRFGLFDPAILAQARKRMAAATDIWSSLAGGDRSKLKQAADQFSLVCDSLRKLHPDSECLAQSLTHAVEATARSGEPPSAALAMEVATAVLYLQASFEELDVAKDSMAQRAACLSERLDGVVAGGEPQPLEQWMEELYRRVSDHQTMGSVVDELRATLAEAEASLDQFFRNPEDVVVLGTVPGRLQQMRGVLSVLGLDQASLAVMRMRDTVERLLTRDVAQEQRQQVFEKLGNSLGALGFLIDMLSYQPAMARKLFVYDEEQGELRILMGKVRSHGEGAGDAVDSAPMPLEEAPLPEPQAEPALLAGLDLDFDLPAADEAARPEPEPVSAIPEPTPAPLPVEQDDVGEDDLLDIFLEEAREVVATGLAAIGTLQENPADLSEQTTLRRAFHTLKGSSRMVGLNAFGEAAWAMEQTLNAWLAEQKPIPAPLLQLSADALQAFARWAGDIEAGAAQAWDEQAFCKSADAMRAEGVLVPLAVPGAVLNGVPAQPQEPEAAVESAEDTFDPALPEIDAEPPADFADTAIAFDLDDMPEEPVDEAAPLPALDLDVAEEIDFALFEQALDAPAAAPQDSLLPALEPEPEPPAPDSVAPEPFADDAVKVIEHLRIGIPLYNVYLNEADEWSRRLAVALQEWSLELHQPVPDTAVAFAHSLAGSSATVGFQALSEMARMLEHALEHVRQLPSGLPEHAKVFNAAADDIRRLLHQFAAGFLKEPNPQVLAQLGDVLRAELAISAAPVDDQAAGEEAAPLDVPEASVSAFAPAMPVAMADDGDEIDAQDVVDPDLFPIFEEEALELLPTLGAALRQWSSRPENQGARSELLRTLHTLKGSARLSGAMRLGEMAHRMETAVEQIDAHAASTQDIAPLLVRFDALQSTFDALRTMGAQALAAPAAVPAAPPAESTAAVQDAHEAQATPAAATALRPPIGMAPAPARAAGGPSVRVRAQLLDRLVNQAGEVMIARSRLDVRMAQMRASLADLTGNLDRLRQHLRDIEVQAESQMQSRLALSKDSGAGFDPLEFDRFTRVQELTRMMAESVNDVATVQRNMQRAMEGAEDDLVAQGRQARELQRDLLRTRMVEFEGISERLYAVVRQSSKDTGKQIKLDIVGGSIEMDRGVLDRMTPAFEHLLRNCAGHGIESAEARTAAGKPAVGTITIELRHEGNDVSVEFRDDGAGLDLARIRDKAVAQGLIAKDAPLGSAEAAQLIFQPGFSTAAQVTGLSGRGIGMDVVRSEVNALGGRIETTTEAGQGTSFRMVLPLTTAVTQVVMLRAGQLTIGVPANLVEIVRRSTGAQVEAAYASHVFTEGADDLAFYWVGALLQSSACSTEVAAKTRPVVILRSASQRIAMHVDEVLGNQEVVVKNLGPQLSRMAGLAGMSVLPSGAVVLIYNPVALATVYGEQVRAAMSAPAAASGAPVAERAPATAQVPLVLVVDDSITVRRVTQRLLQREGYRVALAADGLQALERLQQERPAVVLSDIEMPRMDGFDLARNIRSDAALRDLPIIMITSRIAQKHRDHAAQLGVNHYLGKPYSDEELIGLVQHYARLATADSA